MSEPPDNVTELLGSLDGCERDAALERLMDMVYDELHRLASGYLDHERPDHTLQPTALVNEAFMRLAGQRSPFESRGHFLAIAATSMRRVLVNHARDRGRIKRGGGAVPEMLGRGHTAVDEPDVPLIALDAALERLASFDQRKAKVVEMRYFAGLTVDETATAMGVSPKTVKRDWRFARAWLRNELDESA